MALWPRSDCLGGFAGGTGLAWTHWDSTRSDLGAGGDTDGFGAWAQPRGDPSAIQASSLNYQYILMFKATIW